MFQNTKTLKIQNNQTELQSVDFTDSGGNVTTVQTQRYRDENDTVYII